MPTADALGIWMALLVSGFIARAHFERLTGMTLDQWDDLYCQRILYGGDPGPGKH